MGLTIPNKQTNKQTRERKYFPLQDRRYIIKKSLCYDEKNKISWNDFEVFCVWEGTYVYSTGDLPLHHTGLIRSLRNKTESHPGRCLRYWHKVHLLLQNSSVLWYHFTEAGLTVFITDWSVIINECAFTKVIVCYNDNCAVKAGIINLDWKSHHFLKFL